MNDSEEAGAVFGGEEGEEGLMRGVGHAETSGMEGVELDEIGGRRCWSGWDGDASWRIRGVNDDGSTRCGERGCMHNVSYRRYSMDWRFRDIWIAGESSCEINILFVAFFEFSSRVSHRQTTGLHRPGRCIHWRHILGIAELRAGLGEVTAGDAS
jgi:hypothetical protein